MKSVANLSLGLLLVLLSCSPDSILRGTPDCIRARIEQIRNEAVWNPPASVYRYTYNGQTVYYIPPRCCDIPSVLLDETCAVLCAPDGGLSGGGDGRCSDFFKTRTDEQLVWKDNR